MPCNTLRFRLSLSPTELVAQLANDSHWQVVWLYNNAKPVIGILPKTTFSLSYNDGQFWLTTIADTTHTKQAINLDDYQQKLIAYYAHHQADTQGTTDSNEHYRHGLIGYISYDMGAYALNNAITPRKQPLAFFGHYDTHITYDDTHYYLHTLNTTLDTSAIIARLQALAHPTPPPPLTLKAIWQPTDYAHAFRQTQHYLQAGDAYQINLTQAFVGQNKTPLVAYLPALFAKTCAPFSSYLAIANANGTGHHEIASVSPELFLRFTKDNNRTILTTKPIKGTRPRHSDPTIDEQLKNALKNSEKDLAENVMIVDLLRNDLGKYAKFGKVSVPTRFAIESFSNVHHMVSTVQAELNDTPVLQVLFDSLPAGSITGSPKKRACELIAKLEATPRGAYCGTMGYFNFDNTGQWNVLIRTLQSTPNTTHNTIELWAGGGITVLSDSQEEYQECFDKAGQIIAILAKP